MAAIALIALALWATLPGRIIESLDFPVAVVGWSAAGLHLQDGRIVPLPGIKKLPASSKALSEATSRGVEVSKDGRVFGLVRVHHWCGNDPVKKHIVRVNLSHLLMFVRQGEVSPQARRPKSLADAFEDGGRFTQSGWEIGEFCQFRGWSSSMAIEEAEQAQGRPTSTAGRLASSEHP